MLQILKREMQIYMELPSKLKSLKCHQDLIEFQKCMNTKNGILWKAYINLYYKII